jgi:hypothetical protein
MRDGNSGISWRRDAGGYAWDDFERNARLGEDLRLLASTPEDEWIAALEPNNALPFPGKPNEEGTDLLLPGGIGAPAALSDIVLLGVQSDEQRWIGERVVHYRVAALEQLASAHRNETRISGARAHEIHNSAAGAGLVR